MIESLRRNSQLYNFVIHGNSNNDTISYGSNHTLLMLSEQQQQSFNDGYNALILEEAEKLYNGLKTELTNSAIAAAASIMTSSLPSLDNMQKLTYNP